MVSDARLRVGIVLRDVDLVRHRREWGPLMSVAHDNGLSYVTVGDHVSFRDGSGVDGLIQAAGLLAAHPSMAVRTGIYLLGLRNPVLVARQLATISEVTPGRFAFGVGVGGEDPREFEACGIDPRNRGARTDEALDIVQELLTGRPTSHNGRFFRLKEVLIKPAPDPPIPILIGGRSDAALRRVARVGIGWIGLWVSPQRFAVSLQKITTAAAQRGRIQLPWQHTLHLWCRFGPTTEAARSLMASLIERLYGLPFEKFDRYTPCGTPTDVAKALVPYLEAGCRDFGFIPDSEDTFEAIEACGTVKQLLMSEMHLRA
jgi:alkanesulfonate monooxygenase SsuD/methylene tetrahydromethanopterin reductase-like flavin-dependent oxidoreductase (luciferase family)